MWGGVASTLPTISCARLSEIATAADSLRSAVTKSNIWRSDSDSTRPSMSSSSVPSASITAETIRSSVSASTAVVNCSDPPREGCFSLTRVREIRKHMARIGIVRGPTKTQTAEAPWMTAWDATTRGITKATTNPRHATQLQKCRLIAEDRWVIRPTALPAAPDTTTSIAMASGIAPPPTWAGLSATWVVSIATRYLAERGPNVDRKTAPRPNRATDTHARDQPPGSKNRPVAAANTAADTNSDKAIEVGPSIIAKLVKRG